MIRTLILPLGLAAGLAACAPQVRVSNGTPEPIIKRELAWSGGNTLDVGLPAQVTYVQGPVASVSIEGAKVLVDMVEVHNGVVGLGAAGGSWNEDFDWDGHGFRHTIHIKGNHHHLGSGSALKIRIVSPDVRRFKVGGAARLDIQNYDAPTLQVDADGAGRVTAQVKTGTARMTISGASRIELAGEAQSVTARADGAGRADLSGLKVDDLIAETSGAARLTAASRLTATLDASGASRAELTNRPPKLDAERSGAARVNIPEA